MPRTTIDPEIWKQIQLRAIDEERSTSSVVHEALVAYFKNGRAAKPKHDIPVIDKGRRIGTVHEVTETDKGVEVKATISGAAAGSLLGDGWAEDLSAPRSAEPPKEDPWAELMKPPIKTPEEAQAAAASLPAIHPVPKPTSRPRRPRRSTGKSS